MNQQDLNTARAELIATCDAILESKGSDYAGQDGDRLANFKMVADLLRNFHVDQSSALGVWSIYFLKHVFAILAYAGQHSESEPILARFADARNYLDLGYAIVKEGEGV